MSDIKLPTRPEHLKDATLFGWDLVIGKEQYNVYCITGYNHSIGGKMGLNCYYCCPAKDKLSIENCVAFCGEGAPRWEVRWKGANYHKNKWNEHSIEHRGKWQIYRNEELFFEGGARDMEYGLAKAQVELVWIHEGPIGFHFRNWRDELKDRRIWYHNQPGIITGIIEDGQLCIMIKPDGIPFFEAPPMFDKGDGQDEWWGEDGEHEHKTCMTDPAVYWWRDEEKK